MDDEAFSEDLSWSSWSKRASEGWKDRAREPMQESPERSSLVHECACHCH